MLINGLNGWCTAYTDDAGDSLSGIRLAADPDGSLVLTSADKSLGGLVLPQGMTIDEQGLVYLLLHDEAKIKRFNPDIRSFEELPGIGGVGNEVRQLKDPAAMAVVGGSLYIADRGNRRIQVISIDTYTLYHVWGPADMGGGNDTDIMNPSKWDPIDIVAANGIVYILDRYHAGVYHHKPGTDHPKLLFQVYELKESISRIALDREGRIYLFNDDTGLLEVYSDDGRRIDSVQHPGTVRDRFSPPLLRPDHEGRFCIPIGLLRSCARDASAPSVEIPLEGCPPHVTGGLIFDRAGNPTHIDPTEKPGPKPYLTQGEWFSRPLNSQMYHCQWHRIELDLADLPVGSRVEVSTFTEESVGKSTIPDQLWKTNFAVAGPMQPPEKRGLTSSTHEFLVQSREGKYLRLRLKLSGDGYGTPVINEIRVHYPRQSYLEYLPAVYSEDDDSRWFLERFLSAFQIRMDELEQKIDDIPGLFDPKAVPEGGFFNRLADLIGLPLEGSWNWDQKRRLLAAVPDLYQRRGKPDGLRDFLGVYLANMTGLSTEQVEQTGYPVLVEGFRERQYLMLSQTTSSKLGHGAPLWGPAMVARLQLGVFAREGEARLVSTNDPARDLFHEYAHQFRVFVPAAWIRSAKDERMIRRALDSEKPAHTQYQLCLVDSRFQIGIQSSVGLNTIIGDYPRTRLGCALEPDSSDNKPPPSLSPHGRLGIDTVLSGSRGWNQGLRLDTGARIGADSRIS